MVDFVQIKPTSANITLQSTSGIKQLDASQEANNPIFNFSQKFIDQLQSITTTELGTAVPYIGLRALDEQGKVLHDFNMELFFKTVDFSKLKGGERYSDRPTASLVELKIKTDNSTGYIYFQDVSFQIKLHKPDITLNSMLISLLFPGMPMELEYGWHSNSKNELLNKTEIFSFQLKSYNVNYTQDGQIDLTIDGTAYTEKLYNTLLGDEGEGISDLVSANAKGKKQLNLQRDQMEDILNKDGLTNVYNSLLNYISYLKDLKQNPDKTGIRDMNIVKSSLESYQTILSRARGKTRSNFISRIRQLKLHKQAGPQYQEKKINQKMFRNGMVTLHDLISTLCEGTIDAFSKINPGAKIRFVYGLFHDEVGKSGGKYKSRPIADFPIDYATLMSLFGKYSQVNGTEVLSVQRFIDDVLIKEFLHNEGYWKKIESTDKGVKIPQMYLAVNNYVVNKKKIMDIVLVDINRDIPVTSGIVEDLIKKKDGKSTAQEFEQAIRDTQKNIPIIKLGHGQSFIREISMNNNMDATIKAQLIAKMAETSSTYTRSWIPPGLQNAVDGTDTKTPLHLPLQGTMTVLGSTDWKPFRAFALLSGIFPIDGIFKILAVEHTLNGQGFFTTIQFQYH